MCHSQLIIINHAPTYQYDSRMLRDNSSNSTCTSLYFEYFEYFFHHTISPRFLMPAFQRIIS